MSRENKSKYAIMGLLAISPMSGYDIKKKIERSTSNFWNEKLRADLPNFEKIGSPGTCNASS